MFSGNLQWVRNPLPAWNELCGLTTPHSVSAGLVFLQLPHVLHSLTWQAVPLVIRETHPVSSGLLLLTLQLLA